MVEQKTEDLRVAGSIPALGIGINMSKKKDLGIFALMGGSYFSVRKVSSGTQKHGIQLRKYDPVARKHVLAKSGKSRRISKN